MSVGTGGWQGQVRIGKQAAAGTPAASMYSYDAEDSGGLDKGQTYIDRRPVHGLRTPVQQAHRADVYFPGGDLPQWACGMDANSRILLYMMDMMYSVSATGTSGTTAPTSFTFVPWATQPTIAAVPLYTVEQLAGVSAADERYLDCVASKQEIAWSLGNPLTIKNTIQSLSMADGSLGTALTTTHYGIITAPELVYALTIGGTAYTLALESFGLTTDNGMDDHGAAGAASRNRFTWGDFSGELTMTMPRNADCAAIRAAAEGSVGTLTMTVSPSTGTYTRGGAVLNAVLTAYVQFNRSAMPVGGEGDLTNDLTGPLTGISPSWLVKSDLTAIT